MPALFCKAGGIMNIVVLSGSPRKGGNTAIMVEAFKEGAEAAGHAVEVVDVAAMKIAPCRACKYCFSHGGDCAIPDDMAEVRERLKRADMLVFASPIYWFDISAQLKFAIDRMYAFGGCGFSFSKVALLLDSGSDGVYDAAVAAYKAMSSWTLSGLMAFLALVSEKTIQISSGCTKYSDIRDTARRFCCRSR